MTAVHRLRPHVLVLDDDEELCELISLRLAHQGYRVTTRGSGREALELLEREHVDALLLDLRLDGENGLDVLLEAKRRILDVPIVVLTAHGTIELAVEATRFGAVGFMTKPFEDRELLAQLEQAIEQVRLRRDAAALHLAESEHAETSLVGSTGRMRAVRESIKRVAPTAATVLVLGESGTGKELAARAIHARSGRTGRFVALNCAALPPELLESELFGYRRGAFTGATRDKEGLFAAANGGTLFLDEIGDAPAAVQSKLLRVLQEQTYLALGSHELLRSDARIVAATNRDLRLDIESGRFRADLFYRLHVFPIVLPALRERREDVPLLAELLLERAVREHGLGRATISPEALRVLTQHGWPGNVRELANVIEGAALLCSDGVIRPQHVLAVLADHGSSGAVAAQEEARRSVLAEQSPQQHSALARLFPADESVPSMKEARMAFERAYLTHVLERAGGNVASAARMAARNRTDFYDLLRRHGLDPLTFRR